MEKSVHANYNHCIYNHCFTQDEEITRCKGAIAVRNRIKFAFVQLLIKFEKEVGKKLSPTNW